MVMNSSLRYHKHVFQRRRHYRRGKEKAPRRHAAFPPWYGIEYGTVVFPLEPLLKIILPLGGVIVELVNAHFKLYEDGTLRHVSGFSHCTMYTAFIISGVVDLIGYKVRLPRGTERAFLALAFAMEAFAFAFHIGHRPDLNVRAHVLLCIAIIGCIAFMLLEFSNDSNVIYQIGRGSFTVIQGTWIFHVGFILYGSSPWKDSERTMELLPVVFCWHIMANVFLTSVIFSLTWLTVKCGLPTFCAGGDAVKSNGYSEDNCSILEMEVIGDDAEEA